MRLLPFVVLIWVLTPCLAYAQSDKIGAQINQSLRNFNKDEDANVQGQSDEVTALVAQGLRHYKKGEFAKAEDVGKRAIALAIKKYGAEHPSVATLLNALGVLSKEQGRFEKAEQLYNRSLAMREKVLGPEHSDVGQSLNNLAALYEAQGRLTDAEQLHKRSLAIREKALGPDHPDVGTSLNNLALLYYVQSDWKRSTEFFRRGTDVIARRTRLGTQIIGQGLTGKKKSEAAQSNLAFRMLVKSAHRLTRRNDKATAKLAREMFQTAQWAARSGAAASLAKMAARQATGDTRLALIVRERQDLVDEWQNRDAARGAAVSRPPSKRNAKDESENADRLSTIDKRIVQIDKRLAADFPDYAALANPEPLTIAEVQKQLKPSEALVLFLDTAEWRPTPEETFI